MIRNGEAEAHSLENMVAHLLSLCDLIHSSKVSGDDTPAIKKAFGAKLTASLSREILKLGRGKTDRALLKDFVRVMCSISPDDWVDGTRAVVMRDLADILRTNSSSSLDRATEKLLDAYVDACDAHAEYEGDVTDSDRESFYSLAPGLADFINLLAEDRVVRPPGRRPLKPINDAINRGKQAGGARMSKHVTTKAKRKKVQQDSSDEESDDSDEDGDVESERSEEAASVDADILSSKIRGIDIQ
jgi:hypothetical protein